MLWLSPVAALTYELRESGGAMENIWESDSGELKLLQLTFQPKKCSQKYPQGSSEDSNDYNPMKTVRYKVILWNCIWPRRAYQWTVRLEDYSADFPAGRNWPFVVLQVLEYWKELGIVLMISFFYAFLDSFICRTGWVLSLQAKKILLQTSVYFLFRLIVTAIVQRCRPHSSFTSALCSHLQQ